MTRKRDESEAGVSRTTREIFTNLIISYLRGTFTSGSVRQLDQDARNRFHRCAYWALDASRLQSLEPDARPLLIELFKEFRHAGGEMLILHSDNRMLGMVVQVIANHAGMPLKIVRTQQEFAEFLKEVDLFKKR